MKRGLALLLILLMLSSPLFATVALVLSGGGARGLAHIAIIEAVEAAGIPIDLVVGTSMGALIGGLYSAGYTPSEIRRLIEATDLLGLFVQSPLVGSRTRGRAFSPTYEHTFSLGFTKQGIGDAPAILGDQRIMELFGFLFSKYPDTLDFDDLPIPFRAVSADVVTADTVVHDRGSLSRAIRSSIAIPIVFAPFPSGDGRLLLDGGLVDNLPIQVARELGAEYVIASDVNAEMVEDLALLESLSAIAMQAVVLATRNKTIDQYEHADVLYQIPLKEISVLDFGAFETIIERGAEIAAAQNDALMALSEQIGERVSYDPDRVGAYRLLPEPLIRSVAVVDLSTVTQRRQVEAASFNKFVGKHLDEKTARELSLQLRELRITKNLSTLAYEMGEDDTLLILQRGFRRSNGQIAMGFTSDAGFSNTLVSSKSWFRADAFLDAEIEEVFTTPLTLSISAQLGTRSLMQVGGIYPVFLQQWGAMDVDFSLSYSVGGLTALSAPINSGRSAPLDRLISPTLGIGMTFGEATWLHFDGYYNLAFLHNDAYDPKTLSFGGFSASLLYNTLENRFSSQGMRLDFLASIGLSTRLDWSVRLAFLHKMALGIDDSIHYDLSLSLMRQPFPLIDSYSEIGSVDGIPGYSPLSLKRDSATVGVTWQHRLVELLGYPTYGKLAIRGGIFDSYDPYGGTKASTDALFSALDWDVGFSLSAGLDAPIGEVLLSFGISVKGRWTVAVGIH
ncbi:MAG TPA: patatin-like phospholipase family protein [Sphaerochaeta sp.]|jgi:NTE family protein|nr:patatin-like phospholipase family protein [Spirochaetota bacterium]NLV61025.1 patatin-like phospholipase family protein [Spirochaetales bacterium]HOE84181.1 patatin-like phospholipase family protein [Sphaerochaeta sp.]HOQ93962.1 patatin-like phospholipase family protein [Sphaerochaeta sp.]HPK46616.1 patatin-like phospholipase family protein [Sphaerochaeta sp.]